MGGAPREDCAKCGRTFQQIRRDLSVETMRGAAPLCAVPGCPVVARLSGFATLAAIRGREVEGPSPSVFVGRRGYPVVGAGPLVPPGEAMDPLLSAPPREWLAQDMVALVAMRSRLLRTRAPVHVVGKRDATQLLEAARESAMSVVPVDTAVTLAKEPSLAAPRLDAFAPPMGPGVEVEKAKVIGRAVVPRRVDALVSDTDALATTAVAELADAGVSGYQIERLLAVGLLGTPERRRLVPTRWAITATDDMLSRQILDRVRNFQELGEIRVHEAERFGNRFWIVLLPRAWSFEMVEAWRVGGGERGGGGEGRAGAGAGGWQVARDAEGPRGRSAYVEEVAGAYYAARLAVAEHLERIQRQASVVVCREITEDYWAPLGVWLIRETARLALEAKPLAFGAIDAAVAHVARRSGYKGWAQAAKLLTEAKVQRRLSDFG